MPRHAGTHRFDGINIGTQPLQSTLDGYQSQIDGLTQTEAEHYQQHSVAIDHLRQAADAYQTNIDEHYTQHSEAIQTILKDLDGYALTNATTLESFTITIDPSVTINPPLSPSITTQAQ